MFALNEEALQRLLASPDGDVALDLGRRAQRVETAAKLNATGRPVAGANNPEGRGPRVQSGRLRSSIHWFIGVDERSVFAAIGTNVFYGRILELGLTRNGASYPFLIPALPAAA